MLPSDINIKRLKKLLKRFSWLNTNTLSEMEEKSNDDCRINDEENNKKNKFVKPQPKTNPLNYLRFGEKISVT
jgi:hypothetical protein